MIISEDCVLTYICTSNEPNGVFDLSGTAGTTLTVGRTIDKKTAKSFLLPGQKEERRRRQSIFVGSSHGLDIGQI